MKKVSFLITSWQMKLPSHYSCCYCCLCYYLEIKNSHFSTLPNKHPYHWYGAHGETIIGNGARGGNRLGSLYNNNFFCRTLTHPIWIFWLPSQTDSQHFFNWFLPTGSEPLLKTALYGTWIQLDASLSSHFSSGIIGRPLLPLST